METLGCVFLHGYSLGVYNSTNVHLLWVMASCEKKKKKKEERKKKKRKKGGGRLAVGGGGGEEGGFWELAVAQLCKFSLRALLKGPVRSSVKTIASC